MCGSADQQIVRDQGRQLADHDARPAVISVVHTTPGYGTPFATVARRQSRVDFTKNSSISQADRATTRRSPDEVEATASACAADAICAEPS